jgi:hypothetical protein
MYVTNAAGMKEIAIIMKMVVFQAAILSVKAFTEAVTGKGHDLFVHNNQMVVK